MLLQNTRRYPKIEKHSSAEQLESVGFLSFLFAFGVLILPFDYVSGIRQLGEFSVMAAFYVFFPMAGLALIKIFFGGSLSFVATEVKLFIFLTSLTVILSFIWNAPDIFNEELKGRAALHKAVTTTIAFSFCLVLTVVAAWISRQKYFYRRCLSRPTTWILFMVFSVASIEIIGWFTSSVDGIYWTISSIFRGATSNYEIITGRIKGVSGEPSTLALYLTFAIIWMYYAYLTATKSSIKFFYFLMLFLCIACTILASSRTGYILLAGMAILRLATPYLLKARGSKETSILKEDTESMSSYSKFSMILLLGFICCFSALLFIGHNNQLVEILIQSENVSNISRYGAGYVAFELFLQNSLIGIGLGQYAFQAQHILPDWVWQSYEFRGWYLDPSKTWPSVFSTPARIAAELGILGLLAWYLTLLHLFRRLVFVVRNEKKRIQKLPPLGMCLMLGMVYVILYGIAQESFRIFEAWLIIGFVSSYVTMENPETFYAQANTSKKAYLNTISSSDKPLGKLIIRGDGDKVNH